MKKKLTLAASVVMLTLGILVAVPSGAWASVGNCPNYYFDSTYQASYYLVSTHQGVAPSENPNYIYGNYSPLDNDSAPNQKRVCGPI